MAHRRTSARKPGHDLLANFRQQFPEAAVVAAEKSAPSIVHTSSATDPSALNPTSQHQTLSNVDHGAYHDQDPTPRATHESWRFTPSLLDPNSYVFNAFTNASSGYYTPTPGGSSTLFHSQAGDLHTPALGAGGIGTPLSIPNSGDALQAGTTVVDMAGFQALEPHHFHHLNPFIHNALPPPPPPQAYAPSSFVHQDTTRYETLEQDEPRVLEIPQSQLLRVPSMPPVTLQSQKDSSRMQMSHTLPPNAENFRFHSTLNAPTAMIKEAAEIPISYLNKGQAYSLSIVDTSMHASGSKYRTFVRVSFEDDEQRQKPSVCWGLWKEGRGINEAHQRGGKLQAVEYVDAGQPAESDDKRPHIELESSSFDGFCVTWTPGANGPPELSLAVRFNFLSTDFSHSKGVKGIPVRLCAKTSALSADGSLKDEASTEVCYCKVKLFRDHGAERKLSNDIAHVKKTIEKLKQQLAQIESGTKDVGKRKRRSSVAKMTDCQRPGKVQKHKRTWSLSSASSADGGSGEAGGAGASLAMTLEQDLQMKLQNLQAMFTSTLPISVLYLRGEDLDDPDRHPVSLPGDVSPTNKSEIRDGPSWQARSTKSSINDSMASPCPSSLSITSQVSGVWQNVNSATVSGKPHEQLSRVGRTDDSGILSGWIEALGVDASYRPPSEQLEKAVACVYVQLVDNSDHDKPSYYRAIYLSKRTAEEFNGRVATKWGIPPSSIVRSIRVTREGLEIEVDDDSVRELKEGQDMRMSIEEVFEQPVQTKREWEMSVDDDAGEENDGSAPPARGFVLRLTF
ncbi:hypothetical protein E4U24_002559 [Claviceps purpurea]|nr:hypothetical protein E4U26_004304 [Claviceps purpurea]KAG6236432.1 hypothetical protein E4U25_003695 [Claviceps purpurea]KAG6248697.1 hypothetical protein E4U24_002559 [Claviceps purpurea]KAG6267086.1 hypothetical protein E4U48_005192 [Claviceps purpurea]